MHRKIVAKALLAFKLATFKLATFRLATFRLATFRLATFTFVLRLSHSTFMVAATCLRYVVESRTNCWLFSETTCPSVQWPRKMKTMSCPQGLAYGASCTFTCEPGYDMIGENKITCERNASASTSGFWSSAPPTCDGKLIICWKTFCSIYA